MAVLNLFNAKLFLKRYRWGLNSQDVLEMGSICLMLHGHPQSDSALWVVIPLLLAA